MTFSWGAGRRGLLAVLTVWAMAVALVSPATADAAGDDIDVIATATDRSPTSAADAVTAVGGSVKGS